jgi:uncharacterized protein YyaL (SSP411 family)
MQALYIAGISGKKNLMANRLLQETSPYLLQHAHNPVDWFPWGEEALALAKEQNKPILVSIGYSACHWCHVMERESFENPEVAALMNAYFINIKVDREERPDLDHLYMDALQAMTGGGGWPLNMFLLPDGKPFYGGTYYPPERVYNRSSWTEVITSIHRAFAEKKEDILIQADNLVAHLQQANNFGKAANHATAFSNQESEQIRNNILQQADTEWGGFGRAPKFPHTFAIDYLLYDHYRSGNAESLAQALLSLDKMCMGGLYDRVGGGFSRYSTDAEWLAPHFEKMLYDNALLLSTLASAYQLTKKALYREVAAHTIDFLLREMHEESAFYSALDADSEGIEGKYYTWTKQEINELLGGQSEAFCHVFNILDNGNWQDAPAQIAHHNILWQTGNWEELAADQGLGPAELQEMIQECLQKLSVKRQERIRPLPDRKILIGWNALLITALCKCAQAFSEESYIHIAESCIQFIENKCFIEGELQHVLRNNGPIGAFLDDYAFLTEAYILLQEVTGNAAYLTRARDLLETTNRNFSDEDNCFYYYTPAFNKEIPVRKKEIYDGALPAANSVMCGNLLYLSAIFQVNEWETRAVQMIFSLHKTIIRYPLSFANWALLGAKLTDGFKQVVITGHNSKKIVADLINNYLGSRILQWSEEANNAFELLANRFVPNSTLIYICENNTCKAPITDLTDFLTAYRS